MTKRTLYYTSLSQRIGMSHKTLKHHLRSSCDGLDLSKAFLYSFLKLPITFRYKRASHVHHLWMGWTWYAPQHDPASRLLLANWMSAPLATTLLYFQSLHRLVILILWSATQNSAHHLGNPIDMVIMVEVVVMETLKRQSPKLGQTIPMKSQPHTNAMRISPVCKILCMKMAFAQRLQWRRQSRIWRCDWGLKRHPVTQNSARRSILYRTPWKARHHPPSASTIAIPLLHLCR